MSSDLPASFGALLVATWINVLLYTLELCQIRYFFKHYQDRAIIRSAVLGVLFIDTICTAASCACIYLYTITNWGNAPYLAGQYWPVPLYSCTSGITAAIVQAFLVYRIWVFSKNRVTTFALGLMATTAWVSSVITTVGLIRNPEYTQRGNIRGPVTAWFVSSAISDIGVAMVLVYLFRSMKSESRFRATQNLLHRLMGIALKTGTATAGIATLILALYLQDNQSNFATATAFTMGRVYSITMMYNLNTRKRGRHTGNSNGNSSGDGHQAAISLPGIQVSRLVHVDDELSRSSPAQRSDTVVGADGKSLDGEYYKPNNAAPFSAV